MAPPAFDDELVDRAAILARRALFVASAMSSFTAARIASAQGEPSPAVAPCPADRADDEAAKAAFERAQAAKADGRLPQAAYELGLAYAAHPSRATLVMWLAALERAGQPDRASVAAETHIRCHGDFEELREVMAPIIAGAAHVVVVSNAGPGRRLLIDDVDYDPERAQTGVLIPAGKHRASMELVDGTRADKIFDAVAGGTMTIELVPTGRAMPCLSPPPPRLGKRYRVDGGIVAPHPAFVLTSPTRVALGAGLQVTFTGLVGGNAEREALLMSGYLFGVLVADGAVRALPVGGGIDLYYQAKWSYRCGLGLGGGYMFDATPEDVDGGGVVATPFIGPVATPVSFRWGIAQVELRVPVWFGLLRIDGVEAVRALMIQPYASISFGYGFGDSERISLSSSGGRSTTE